MKVPAVDNLEVINAPAAQSQHQSCRDFTEKQDSWLTRIAIEECIGGILVFSDQKQLIYASDSAHSVLRQLHQDDAVERLIPNEIQHICESLVQSRHLFPDQNWLMEFDIFTSAATTLHIRSRWFSIDGIDRPCLLLTIEDRQQAIANIVLEEADRYGLTRREKEVWLLQHNGSTYKQIAEQLGITPNTVKKHVRSIYAKKKKPPEPGEVKH